MSYDRIKERNRKQGFRITEIPPSDRYNKLNCPCCKKPLQVGVGAESKCEDVTTYCKNCKRTLLVEAAAG